jgi:hypothetical protein
LNKYKSPDGDEILAELIQAGCEIVLFAIHKLIKSVSNTEELPDQWEESINVGVHKNGDKTDCNNYRGISLPSTSYKILFYSLKVKIVTKLLGAISVGLINY